MNQENSIENILKTRKIKTIRGGGKRNLSNNYKNDNYKSIFELASNNNSSPTKKLSKKIKISENII